MFLVHRFARRHVSGSVALIGVVSFLLCLWARSAAAAAKFYLLGPCPTCDGRQLAGRLDLKDKIVFFGPKDWGVTLKPAAAFLFPHGRRPASSSQPKR
jgi:hypothetical protein